MFRNRYNVIVIGGGHAGIEAAWAAANLLGSGGSERAATVREWSSERENPLPHGRGSSERESPTVALVTLDPTKIGEMSCNPAIGGLAKGQLVREIDAMGGLMGLLADATGIHFKMLNTSKGPAVHGPRCQSDKEAYAEAARAAIMSRPEIEVVAGAVETLRVSGNRITGVGVRTAGGEVLLESGAVVLTTGTFMRGLMHTGDSQTAGGRHGEGAAGPISDALRGLGLELGRLKTGTPPRLKRGTIDWESLELNAGDDEPRAFSELAFSSPGPHWGADGGGAERSEAEGVSHDPLVGWASSPSPVSRKKKRRAGSPSYQDSLRPGCAGPPPPSATGEEMGKPALALGAPFTELADRFPVLEQIDCRRTQTSPEAHEIIRANLHRAPLFTGQIDSAGPRYCPSIEDKVVRFEGRDSHGVYLEPESLRTDWVYCNGISSSLPADVQDIIVRTMPGCEHAEIVRYGYAVEYDTVMSHQIRATGETDRVAGLFLAGQINGTSGYEEAAAQGLVAGINAARLARSEPADFMLRRDEAYIGVMMDDLVTKTPVEPYRMFTSRAEHRLLLRADNASDRLTPIAARLGLLGHTDLGRLRAESYRVRTAQREALIAEIGVARVDGLPLGDAARKNGFGVDDLRAALPGSRASDALWRTVHADLRYEPYVRRQHAEVRRQSVMEHRRIPGWVEYAGVVGLRAEALEAFERFRPETYGQAGRLEGVTPADLTLLTVHVQKSRRGGVD